MYIIHKRQLINKETQTTLGSSNRAQNLVKSPIVIDRNELLQI